MTNEVARSFRQRLDDPQARMFGAFFKMPSLEAVEIFALAGFDFVIIDLEHSTLDLDMASALISVCASHGMAPVVRIPDPDHSIPVATRLLDAGATGILVPHIRSKAQAEQVIRSMLPPPLGTRGAGGGGRAGKWGFGVAGEYNRAGKEDVALILMIEDPEAVEAIDEILEVKGFAGIFIGAGDLSQHFGVPGRMPDGGRHPEVQKRVDRVLQACAPRGIPCSIAGSADQAARLMKEGFRFPTIGNDTGLLAGAARSAIAQAREAAAKR